MMAEYKRTGKSRYTLKNEALNKKIEELINASGSTKNGDLLAEMATTVMKLAEDKVDRGDLKILNTSLKELRWAFKVFRPSRQIRKVAAVLLASGSKGKRSCLPNGKKIRSNYGRKWLDGYYGCVGWYYECGK